MSNKRMQGRPARGADEVGRGRIVEGMRAALRARAHTEITRNEIAERAGVTPALVSYYFPDRETLLIAAAGPVVEDYARQFRLIATSDLPAGDRLLTLIELVAQCHLRDAHLLDAFSHRVSRASQATCPDHLASMVDDCAQVIARWIEDESSDRHDADFMNDVIWALCQFMTRTNAAARIREEGVNARTLARLIYDFVTRGRSGPGLPMAASETVARAHPRGGDAMAMMPSAAVDLLAAGDRCRDASAHARSSCA